MHLAQVSTLRASARRNIRFDTKLEIWGMPCAVCGVPWWIAVDHIVPVACGGGNERSNLQPLCRWCNANKKHTKTNRDIAREILTRGPQHFLNAAHLWGTRHYNCYDGPGLDRWLRDNPVLHREALRLHQKFAERHA